MRLLFLLLLLLGLSAAAYSQTTASDSVFLVPVPGPNDKVSTLNLLTPEESEALREQYGIYIIQMVDPPNTYRWNDGTEKITFAPEVTKVTIGRYDDAEGNQMGYMIFGSDESDRLPSKNKAGLFRKVEERN
ncbi:MAG: hypothetical protein AB8H12_14535 [Lewinella sp.]